MNVVNACFHLARERKIKEEKWNILVLQKKKKKERKASVGESDTKKKLIDAEKYKYAVMKRNLRKKWKLLRKKKTK